MAVTLQFPCQVGALVGRTGAGQRRRGFVVCDPTQRAAIRAERAPSRCAGGKNRTIMVLRPLSIEQPNIPYPLDRMEGMPECIGPGGSTLGIPRQGER